MKMRDRMQRASPLMKALISRLDTLIAGHNELVTIVLRGQQPHKTNDAANVLTLLAANVIDDIIDLEQQVVTKYGSHIGSTNYHIAADTDNQITELGVPEEIYTLLNELKVDYELNRINPALHHGTGKPALIYALQKEIKDEYNLNRVYVTSHHGFADGTNEVAVADSDDKATAFALANDVKAKLNAHMIWEGEDTANLYLLMNEIKAEYADHKALVDSVHAGADSGNGITADDASSKATAWALANDTKAMFIANYANTSSHHTAADTVNPPDFTDLDGDSTWLEIISAANDLRTSYVAHIAASTVWHGAADGTNVITKDPAVSTHGALDETNTVIVGDLDVESTWVEIAALTDACRTSYEAHRQMTDSIHAGSDATHPVDASAIGSIEALVDLINVVTAVPDADTKAKAVTLANALKTKLNLHLAVTLNVHTSADTNVVVVADLVPASATWTLIAGLADAIRVAYEAHRALVGSVHDGADATNTVDATAVGAIQTAINAGLNEAKADFNAHIQEGVSYHYAPDTSMKVLTADASSLSTSKTLVNVLRTSYTDHISRASEIAAGPVVPTLDEE